MATNVSSAAGPVSVAGSSSAQAAGGSVINVSSLVSQLVAASEASTQCIRTVASLACVQDVSK